MEKKKEISKKLQEPLREDSQMLNDDKTENAILKRFKQTKDSKKETWRHAIKSGLKLGAKEDIAYRNQFSSGCLKKPEEIIERQGKVSAEKRVKLYNILVRSTLHCN